MQTRTFQHAVGAVNWYCELRGSGPGVVLIPSGEGDCSNFEAVAEGLADEFTVLTFDTPGFSRSTAPVELIRPSALASQIAELVKSLEFAPATFYGCSSGGIAVLSLAADHPEVVRNCIVHEAALVKDYAWPEMEDRLLRGLGQVGDAGIAQACKAMFRDQMNQYPEKWDALGEAYHQRLARNYVTWIRQYGANASEIPSYTREQLTRRPVAWSIGGFSPVWFGISNLRVAARAGIEVAILRCRHFPQVEIPEDLVSHIRQHTREHLALPRARAEVAE